MPTSVVSGSVSQTDEVHVPGTGAAPMDAPSAPPREEFWNLPNTITVFRMGVVPVLLLLPFFQGKHGSQFMAWCFIVAASSDVVDGWLARRGAQVTKIGKLLDPLADKLIIATALIMLLAVDRIPLWAVPMVVVIIGRELAVTGLRGLASTHGQVMAANKLAKLKTVTQNVAVGAMLFHFTTIGIPAREFGLALLSVATLLTLWSGYAYFAEYFGLKPDPQPVEEES